MNDLAYFINLIKTGAFDKSLTLIREACADRVVKVQVHPDAPVTFVVGDTVTVRDNRAPWRQYQAVGWVKKVSDTTLWIVPIKERCTYWARLTGFQQVRGFKVRKSHVKHVA